MPENFERKTLSRRDFLKSSAAVTASTAISTFGAPAIIQAQSLMNPVNYGFIGSGRQGCNHLKHLSTIKTGRCAVISDIYPPNLKKGVETIGGNPETIPDKDPFAYRKLLDRKDIEAVFIVTPYHLHVPMILDALSAGKHVFVEKCLMKTEDQIPKVYKAANAHPNLYCRLVYRGAIAPFTESPSKWSTMACWEKCKPSVPNGTEMAVGKYLSRIRVWRDFLTGASTKSTLAG